MQNEISFENAVNALIQYDWEMVKRELAEKVELRTPAVIDALISGLSTGPEARRKSAYDALEAAFANGKGAATPGAFEKLFDIAENNADSMTRCRALRLMSITLARDPQAKTEGLAERLLQIAQVNDDDLTCESAFATLRTLFERNPTQMKIKNASAFLALISPNRSETYNLWCLEHARVLAEAFSRSMGADLVMQFANVTALEVTPEVRFHALYAIQNLVELKSEAATKALAVKLALVANDRPDLAFHTLVTLEKVFDNNPEAVKAEGLGASIASIIAKSTSNSFIAGRLLARVKNEGPARNVPASSPAPGHIL